VLGGVSGRQRASATIKFASSTRIAVTVSGTTTNFNFASSDGEWRTGLLESPDFAALASGLGNGAFDRVIKALDDALSRADGLDARLAEETTGLANTGQADLARLFLGSGLQSAPDDPVGLARLTAAMLIGSPGGLVGNRVVFWS
jgi:hypothetical protein